MNLYNDYSLMNATHIYNGKYMKGYDVIRDVFGGTMENNRMQDLCVMMWLKSPHPHMMPWFTVRCDISNVVDYILCESTDNTTASSKLVQGHNIVNKSKVIVSTEPICDLHHTLIANNCLRVHHLKSTYNDKDHKKCLPIWVDGFDTRMSSTEHEKINLFLFLENWIMATRILESPEHPIRIATRHHCFILERTVRQFDIVWLGFSDCQIYRKLQHQLWSEKKEDSGNLHYSVIECPATMKCGYAGPPGTEMIASDYRKVHYSSYLSKITAIVKGVGLAIPINSSHCWLSYPSDAGDPPYWYSMNISINCNSSNFVLCAQDIISDSKILASPNDMCCNNHFRCEDGTCISQSYRCDITLDCPDHTDEVGCPQVCTKVMNDKCFQQCDYPACECSMLYYHGIENVCKPIWNVTLEQMKAKDNSHFVKRQAMRQRMLQGNKHVGTLHTHSLDGQGSPVVLPTDVACIYFKFVERVIDHSEHLRHCYHHECLGMFKCYRSYCIPYHYVCDRQSDCPAGEDENACENLVCPGLLKC